jgi:ubiquitin carboxyl-terminal hydrolase 8
MDLSKYHGKGLCGLANLGNTCFLNSCIQVLNHIYELDSLLLSPQYQKYVKNELSDSIIINEWNALRTIMWNQNAVVSPNRFVANVQQVAMKKNRELFTGWAQNDMPEFLLFLIECMHNSISRNMVMKIRGNTENDTDHLAVKCFGMLKDVYEKEYSEIMDLFYGIYVSQIISMNGQTIHNIKPESFFILDLPIPLNKPTVSIYDCLDYFTMSETMSGENAWYNEKTQSKEDIQKTMGFWNFPKILVITLKRFSPDGSRKLMNLIDFPLENLDLSKYVQGYNPKQYVYDLFGICNHMGGVMGGHYTSFVKNSSNEWYHFNDTNVGRIQTVVTPMAYCLFYRKKNKSV